MMKGKDFFYGALIWLSVCMGLGYATEAKAALNFLDDKVKLTGFLENQTAMRLENGVNESDRLSRMRTTLQVEGAAEMAAWLKFNAIVRGAYEASYSLVDNIDKTPASSNTAPGGRNGEGLLGNDRRMESDVDLREYHFRLNLGNSTLKVGRQQIVWGEADLFRMSDIINPLDMSFGGIFVQDLENVRIPLRALDFVQEFPGEHNFKVELVAIPEDFRSTQLASPMANWDPLWSTGMPVPYAQLMWQTQEKQLRELQNDGLNNFQGGVRLRGKFGDWDTALFYFYSRVQDAVMTGNSNFNPLLVPPGGFPTVDNFNIQFHWPRVQNIGGTFNVPIGAGFILRGEGAYTIDQPFTQDAGPSEVFNTALPMPPFPFPFLPLAAVPGTPSAQYGKSDVLAFFIGFDRPTMMTFLNPTQSFFISGQLYQKYIMNPDDRFNSTSMGEDGRASHQMVATLLINTEYFDGKIAPEVIGAYDPGAASGLVKASLTYKPTYKLSVSLGGIWLFAGENTSALTGAFQKNDEVSLVLKYTF